MNRQIATQTLQQKPTATPSASGLLQRKCACGTHTMAGAECAECSKKNQLGLQTKLKINEPGDIYEREADRIADQVMSTPAHHAVSGAPPRIQRFTGQSTGQMDAVPASVDQALASPGRPLEPALRQDMEQRFGHDFSRVRVHTDARASTSAEAVHAQAYTVGHDIVFTAGSYTPGTSEGRRLLAHELIHVLQQRPASRPGLQAKLEIGKSGDAYERQADLIAHQVTRTPGGPDSAPAHNVPTERLHSPPAPRLMRQVGSSQPRQTPPDLNSLFSLLWGLRLSLRPEEFHQLAYRFEVELFSLLNRFGYKGSQATPEGTLKDFGAAYQEWRARISSSRSGMASAAPQPISDEDSRQRIYQTMAGDPIAALLLGIALFVEATVLRPLGAELDPARAAALAQTTSLLAQVYGSRRVQNSIGKSERDSSGTRRPPASPTAARPAPAPVTLAPAGRPAPVAPVRVPLTSCASRSSLTK
jgi:hypothetical protein